MPEVRDEWTSCEYFGHRYEIEGDVHRCIDCGDEKTDE